MKLCPQCSQMTTDDALTFCRADGARLVHYSDSFSNGETVLLEPDTQVAATAIMDAQLIAPAASAGLIDSSKAPDSKHHLIEWSRAKFIAVAAAAFIGLAVAASAYHSVSRKSNAAINSLAVLPFINVNADQQLDYLSDGMTETLIYNLSQLPNLNVKARSSVFRYKGSDVTPRTVGAELNVQAVLNGRIAERGELFTLSLELADARTENVIWSEQYRRKQTELVSLQSEIARDVSRKLRVKLAGADEQKLWKSDTTVEEAYHLYLEGRYHWNK
jgi:TolB-like protein